MPAVLSDAELLAQRARRIGRPVMTAPAGGPGTPREALDPTGGMGLTDDAGDTFTDEPTPAPRAPTGNPAPAPQSNELAAQVAQLQQQLNAALGRVSPAQQQLEELRTTAQQQAATIAKLQADLSSANSAHAKRTAQEAAAEFDPYEGMTAEELAMIDPAVLDTTRRATRAAIARVTSQMPDPQALLTAAFQERDARELRAFMAQAEAELKLGAVQHDSKFMAFAAEDDSADMLMHSFLNAPDLSTARSLQPRVRSMLKRYERTVGNSNLSDPPARASEHLSRTPAANGSPQAPRGAITPDQAAKLRREHAAAVRTGDRKKAAELLQRLTG